MGVNRNTEGSWGHLRTGYNEIRVGEDWEDSEPRWGLSIFLKGIQAAKTYGNQKVGSRLECKPELKVQS